MMTILFVEDNDGFAGDLLPFLEKIPNVGNVLRAKDKASATKMLADELIDLVILDLSIPPHDETESHDPEHGQALFYDAMKLRPSTPIFILTGSEVQRFSQGLAKHGNQVKLWGSSSKVETVSFFLKEDVQELLTRVRELAVIFGQMDAVEVNTRGKNLGLTLIETRMLKTFARNEGGESCDVSFLSGGLSEVKVVKATAYDRARKPQSLSAAKLGSREATTVEYQAYQDHARKLAVGACPPLVLHVEHGVGQHGGIFYTLTDEDTQSFFDRLQQEPAIGPEVVKRVRNGLHRWTEAAKADRTSISSVRARLVDDTKAAALEAKHQLAELRTVESRSIVAMQGCIHGDLHCGNVLVNSNGEAVIIDFGEAAHGFSVLDPIALELSVVFHPDSKKHGLAGDLMDRLEDWSNLEKYVGGHPLRAMIEACREWAHDVAGGDLDVLAGAYAYALRQLKYDTVSADKTMQLLHSLSKAISEK